MGKFIFISNSQEETVDETYFATSYVQCLTELIESAIFEDENLLYAICSGNGDWISFRGLSTEQKSIAVEKVEKRIESLLNETLEFDYCLMHGIFIWQTNILCRLRNFDLLPTSYASDQLFFPSLERFIKRHIILPFCDFNTSLQEVIEYFFDWNLIRYDQTAAAVHLSNSVEIVNDQINRLGNHVPSRDIQRSWRYLYLKHIKRLDAV